MNHAPLIERTAVVCGSSQGIGRACAEELARLGATVTLMARDGDALSRVAGELPAEQGQQHGFVVADFTDWSAVGAAADAHLEEAGPVHILVNNTGGPKSGPAIDAEPQQFADAFAMHVLCNQALVRAFVEGMRSAKFGRIINIISTSVITPLRNLGVSNTIRGAVANWGRTLAAELAPDGITVNNILPGLTDTERLQSLFTALASRAGREPDDIQAEWLGTVPSGRLAAPSEIAAVVGFLATPAAAYVNGVNLPVDAARVAAQ